MVAEGLPCDGGRDILCSILTVLDGEAGFSDSVHLTEISPLEGGSSDLRCSGPRRRVYKGVLRNNMQSNASSPCGHYPSIVIERRTSKSSWKSTISKLRVGNL